MNAYLDERVEVPNHILVRERPQQAYFFQALRSRCFRFAAIAAAATAARFLFEATGASSAGVAN